MKLKSALDLSKILNIITLAIFLISGYIIYLKDQESTESHSILITLQQDVHDAMALENEFFIFRDEGITERARAQFNHYSQTKHRVSNLLLNQPASILLLEQVDSHIKEFEITFYQIVDLQKQIGFDENKGLRFKFRSAVHALQKFSQELNSKEFEILILEIRRREKDYLLRFDEKYLLMHQDLVLKAKQFLNSHELASYRNGLIRLNTYQRAFQNLITLLNSQGLTENSGLKGKNVVTKQAIDEKITSLIKLVNANLAKQTNKTLLYALSIIFITIILAYSLSHIVHKRLATGFFSFNTLLDKIAQKDDFSLRANLQGEDEVTHFSHNLNHLLNHIEELLTKLEQAQNRLVEDAKMASLGSMVSGFAHELNTPLGIAITSESHLRSKLANLKHDLEAGKLQKSSLEALISEADTSLNLMESNLNRTATLITSFKQVAAHQQYDEIIEFNLLELVESVFHSFSHELNKLQVKSQISVPPNLLVKSYFGAFNQIIGILINNSLKHGVMSDHTLTIEVTIKVVNGIVHFRYSDDGKGIEESILDKVFEPFVTTKRNSGGTGLGLSIVYGLVTQKLEGELELHSVPNKGAVFYMHLPRLDYRHEFE